MGSAASTWSRTGRSGSRVARSTRCLRRGSERPRSSHEPAHATGRGTRGNREVPPCAASRVSRDAAGRKTVTLWAGRVGVEPAVEVWEFLRADDAELLPYDCAATLEHAHRLAAVGILTSDELAEVEVLLAQIDSLAPEDEDVHSAIERQLGEVGRKIHAGRS